MPPMNPTLSYVYSQPVDISYDMETGATQKRSAVALSAARKRSDDGDALRRYRNFMIALCAVAALTSVTAFLSMGAQYVYVLFVMAVVLSAIIFTLALTTALFAFPGADEAMNGIADAIREGAEGFLRVQYTSIAVIAVAVAVLLATVYSFRTSPSPHISSVALAAVTAIAYIIGAFCSGLAGFIGVWVSVRINIRVSICASRLSYNDALVVAFRGGAVSAVLSAALCILGLTVIYVTCHLLFCVIGGMPSSDVPMLLAGYSFGGALVALFMQLGGGIYTKAADVGADMCGKIEANIPEDDCRNPAVIADLVGDNVGDCAGSMADVFESIAAEIIGTMILGATLAHEAHIDHPEPFIFFPLVIHSLDLAISAVGIMAVRPLSDNEDPLESMKRSYIVCMAVAAVAFVLTCRIMLYHERAPDAWWHYALCGLIGIVMSFAIIRVTQHYTDYSYGPVKRIAAASQTGHGTKRHRRRFRRSRVDGDAGFSSSASRSYQRSHSDNGAA